MSCLSLNIVERKERLIQQFIFTDFKCDSIISMNYKKYPFDLKFVVEDDKIYENGKNYYKFYDIVNEDSSFLGYLRSDKNKLYFLASNYQEWSSDDTGHKEQIIFDSDLEIGDKLQVKGLGLYFPYHNLTLISKEYNSTHKDTIYSFQAKWIMVMETHSTALRSISIGPKAGITNLVFGYYKDDEEYCECRKRKK